MKRMMSWTPTPSHLMKQMPRKRGPRHKGLESTKWNDEISYLGPEKLMSFWAIFLVLNASLICGNPLFGCYKGGNIRRHTIHIIDGFSEIVVRVVHVLRNLNLLPTIVDEFIHVIDYCRWTKYSNLCYPTQPPCPQSSMLM